MQLTEKQISKLISDAARASELFGDDELERFAAQHCQCRSGSPDTCPICTDMETGEKFVDQ